MSPHYTFKDHKLSPVEHRWLTEAATPGFSPRAVKAKLYGQLPRDFSPRQINPYFYANDRVTPLGIWYLDPHNPVLDAMDRTARHIKECLLKDPLLPGISAQEIATAIGLKEDMAAQALLQLSQVGHFFRTAVGSAGGNGFERIELNDDGVFDEYLHYENLEELFEQFYTRNDRGRQGSDHPSAQHGDTEGSTPLYTEQAAEALYAAIETCIGDDGRAHRGNVPRTAERILLSERRGTIDTAQANQQIQAAIDGLVHEGRIDAPAERHRDWRILIPLSPRTRIEAVPQKVFIVHGHDDGTKQTVARFIEKLGFEAIILHERANKGRTILTKFREESESVGFAIVLMTPDDVGRASGAPDLKPRARQNVVFELGFFIGSLQPERVAALVKGNIEKPSDFDGVVYISLDGGSWQTDLGKELKAAGFEFDWNKVLA